MKSTFWSVDGGRLTGLLLVFWCVLAGVAPARAAEPAWPRAPFDYVTVEEELSQVLRNFAAYVGVTLKVSPRVQGVVRGRLPQRPPREFLDTLARTYGLTWYFDGYILYIYSLDEVESRILKLDSVSPAGLARSLRELSIWDDRFPWTTSSTVGILFVSGPPRYVELVLETAKLMESSRRFQVDIRTFPLQHANAEDRRFTVRGSDVLVPGVAAILRNVISSGGGRGGGGALGRGGAASGPNMIRLSRTNNQTNLPSDLDGLMAELRATGQVSPPGQLEVPGEQTVRETIMRESDTEVRIESDPRTNSVIVKDFVERMPIYERIIRDLDRPQKLVEVELVIADINTSRLEELGVDWALGFSKGDTNIGIGVGDVAQEVARTGLTFATAITGDPFSFLSRVRALETNGDARVISRPSILTFDNVESVFDQSQSFFVRLEGERAVDLVQIQVGLLIKVRPHLIFRNNRFQVQMAVDIEDGTTSSEQVDNLPVLLRSTISTQGIVGEQQGLVIGGFYRQEQINNLQKVPWLADIPILGWALFRNKSLEENTVTRLFVLRPVVVDVDRDGPFVTGFGPSGLGPRPLSQEPPNAYTPSRSVLRSIVRFGRLLDERVKTDAEEVACLTRSMQGSPCAEIDDSALNKDGIIEGPPPPLTPESQRRVHSLY